MITMKRAVFLDRDGVINRKAPEGQYILCREDLEILPGVPAAIHSLNRAGFLVIIITNQRCIARGLLSEDELDYIHKDMLGRLLEGHAHIDAIYVCPHASDAGCDCRKPQPGMIREAASDHNVDLSRSWMIGDDATDVAAGEAAGCQTILVASGASANGRIAASLDEAAAMVLRESAAMAL